jgi:hypothetical protein
MTTDFITRREEEEAEAKYQATFKPLPDAADVRRYIEASQAAARAHLTLLAEGHIAWADGTPLHPLLYRLSKNDSEKPLYKAMLDLVDRTVGELAYASTMIEDALRSTADDHGRQDQRGKQRDHLRLMQAALILAANGIIDAMQSGEQ